jgi:hypothetical protein
VKLKEQKKITPGEEKNGKQTKDSVNKGKGIEFCYKRPC